MLRKYFSDNFFGIHPTPTFHNLIYPQEQLQGAFKRVKEGIMLTVYRACINCINIQSFMMNNSCKHFRIFLLYFCVKSILIQSLFDATSIFFTSHSRSAILLPLFYYFISHSNAIYCLHTVNEWILIQLLILLDFRNEK